MQGVKNELAEEVLRQGMVVQQWLESRARDVRAVLFDSESSDEPEEMAEEIRSILYDIISDIQGSYYWSGRDGLDARFTELIRAIRSEG